MDIFFYILYMFLLLDAISKLGLRFVEILASPLVSTVFRQMNLLSVLVFEIHLGSLNFSASYYMVLPPKLRTILGYPVVSDSQRP